MTQLALGTDRGGERSRASAAGDALSTLARAAASAAARPALADALDDLAEAARGAAGADVVVIRLLDLGGERLEAVSVAGPPALVAEVEGTQLPVEELPATTVDDLDVAPGAIRRAAGRAAARSVFVVPLRLESSAATIELFRAGRPFARDERLAAELVAGQTALVLRAHAADGPAAASGRPSLELAGEALAAALGEAHTATEVARIAATAAGAAVGLLWQGVEDDGLVLAGAHGVGADADLTVARALAEQLLQEQGPGRAAEVDGLPGACAVSATLPLGQPPFGALQLLFERDDAPASHELARLATLAVRSAHALRASSRAAALELELERTRALLAVVGQATAELSLAHTLDTAVERVAELLAVEQVAVYLLGDAGTLAAAAARGLAGPHVQVGEQLLELALGSARGRPVVQVVDLATDERLRAAAHAAAESALEAALAAPLRVRGEVTGLLAVYPRRGRRPTEREHELLVALAGQLAVAVQNAQLHEQAKSLGGELESVLSSERAAARRLRALYEISRSFAQSLSLEATLDALARTIVDVLDVDAALIRMPDARREQLLPRAIHVKDAQLAAAARSILFRPVPFGTSGMQRLFRLGEPVRLTRPVRTPTVVADLLAPFLERGWTAATVPVGTPAEVIASLSILSFRPGSPIGADTIDAAAAIAGQAALAIDNARLYQQQKEFADTMQRSLLPHSRPDAPGLAVGEVYESSARVDVGGDVYDFLTLDDGRLAVVLGDVTGHGVEATADMAMAKFVFRSLAREHPRPSDFLAAANDVVVGEIAAGKFISMAYLVVDGRSGEAAYASAGHPAARLVLPDGDVRSLDAAGLVLGIDVGQEYGEASAELPPGASIVLYTDGVVEARRNGDLYGTERLDALLRERRELPAHALAHAVAEDARRFAGGELSDDLAVVVIRRLSSER